MVDRSQRIDAVGVAEPEVTRGGTSNILIQLPGLENEEQALELVGTTAQLTFRQVEEIIPPNAPLWDDMIPVIRAIDVGGGVRDGDALVSRRHAAASAGADRVGVLSAHRGLAPNETQRRNT
mgnify:CR=1 FL=1